MDISKLKRVSQAEIEIKDDSGNGTGIYFTIAGPSHPARVAAEKRVAVKITRDFNKRGKVTVDDDPDDQWDQETARLVALTLSWRDLEIDGKKAPYSADLARQLYDNRDLCFRERVSEGLKDMENFSQGSQINSSSAASAASA